MFRISSRVLHDVEREFKIFEKAGATDESGEDLVMTVARTKEISEFTMLTGEPAGGTVAVAGLQHTQFIRRLQSNGARRGR